MRRAIDVTILHLQQALEETGHGPWDLDLLKPGLLYGDHVHLFTPNKGFIEYLRQFPDWEHQPLERRRSIARAVAKAMAESEELDAKLTRLADLDPHGDLTQRLRRWLDPNEEDFDDFLKTIMDALFGFFRNEIPGADPIIRLMQVGLVSLYSLDYEEDLGNAPSLEFPLAVHDIAVPLASQSLFDEKEIGDFLSLFAKRMWKIWDTPDAFPLLDETLGSWAELLSSQHPAPHGKGSGRQKELRLAGQFFGQLPGFQRATVDELLDIRKELDGSLQRFRLALAGISEELTDTRDADKFRGEARSLWTTEVLPVIQEIDDSVRANKYLYQLTEHLLSKPDGLVAAGGVAIGAVAAHDVPGFAAAAAAAALPAARAFWDSWKEKVNIRHNKFYFIYSLNRRLPRP